MPINILYICGGGTAVLPTYKNHALFHYMYLVYKGVVSLYLLLQKTSTSIFSVL